MYFFTILTLKFTVLYGLIAINYGTRKIEHFAVTRNPIAERAIGILRQELLNHIVSILLYRCVNELVFIFCANFLTGHFAFCSNLCSDL